MTARYRSERTSGVPIQSRESIDADDQPGPARETLPGLVLQRRLPGPFGRCLRVSGDSMLKYLDPRPSRAFDPMLLRFALDEIALVWDIAERRCLLCRSIGSQRCRRTGPRDRGGSMARVPSSADKPPRASGGCPHRRALGRNRRWDVGHAAQHRSPWSRQQLARRDGLEIPERWESQLSPGPDLRTRQAGRITSIPTW